MAYRYQKELDLLEATKEELNITDAQYDELTTKMKDEGNAEWFKPWKEPQFSIKSYWGSDPIFNSTGASIFVAFRCREGDWFSYENGEQVEWSWKNEKLGTVQIYYGRNETDTSAPPIATFTQAEGASGEGKANAFKNVAPPQAGNYGKYCVACFNGNFTEEDFEDAKKNLKIKIG